MSILYCLNPECSHPQNPTHYSYCQGCGGNLSQTSQSYSFHSRYVIVGVLGEGAFGRTYQAKDLNFNQKPCVIKKFITQMQGSALEKSKELFQREAEKLDELKHEQIPTVYDYFSEGNSLYLVQEFIEGETLLQEYQREGRFSEQKIKEILEDLLPVLDYLDSQGLIHRDIKPDNLMRRRSDGKLMLIDFGGIKEQTSQMGTGLYTPGYAAYEHIMGRAVAASDLYSLAATCVRLLTGCLPPGDSNLVDPVYDVDDRKWLWQSVLKSQKRSISDFLANILNKMLEDKSSRRYQSASEVLTALNNLPSSVTIVQPPPKTTIRSGITRRKWLYNSVGMIVFGGAIGLAIYSMANYNLGDKQGAIADKNQAIKLNSDDAVAYYNNGVAKYKLGDNQGAIKDFNQAIQINPDYANAYYDRGSAKSNLGDKQGAIKDYNQAIQINPDDADFYNNRGWAKYNLGDKQGAIKDYNQAIKLNPDFAFPYNNRGWAKYNLGDKQGAIADYNQAIKLNSDFAVPYYNRGLIYKELNDNEKAIKDFRQAAKLHRQQNNQTWYQNSLDRLKELGVSN
ncbi:MAG: tetratricopeptide repeat protein [Microcystis panniformis Mp_MB_F_20051200_S9]|uniref:Tetratricopeptide repeat protein n=1 Tax=Microcystis panniformis Mp_MB_F_20051200_S9 TaxID=2486223 RepID=A0A552Q4R7_9CHRO|nr:MAG: tetratricopeptide repeat protein [Microcystis panniformis Mp_GB_SS_20050300_S99D]TRV48373.1 MAG: tetratricopeptide repeat protein [Microcystis panniformis Mp_GB_SS_20050300_S99]TRV50712.1 MAG: tetratricopeptide repeat protein [Microcystis panniformis Mp_MB_F_20080800_S26D]TRV62928.1 MAG: tetratricopeptide repeat protein [Microcystis panniformis Mp_MB_F_20080800_S26]TRV64204.1 MAG: tetratricopeptide repeat protein [Microcystis panniformis Mp_MB_F_20051200_S9]TRV66624.1 MAG: tetratricope